jgi:hypothetical protein
VQCARAKTTNFSFCEKLVGQTRPIRALCAVSPLSPYRASLGMLLLCMTRMTTPTPQPTRGPRPTRGRSVVGWNFGLPQP